LAWGKRGSCRGGKVERRGNTQGKSLRGKRKSWGNQSKKNVSKRQTLQRNEREKDFYARKRTGNGYGQEKIRPPKK